MFPKPKKAPFGSSGGGVENPREPAIRQRIRHRAAQNGTRLSRRPDSITGAKSEDEKGFHFTGEFDTIRLKVFRYRELGASKDLPGCRTDRAHSSAG